MTHSPHHAATDLNITAGRLDQVETVDLGKRSALGLRSRRPQVRILPGAPRPPTPACRRRRPSRHTRSPVHVPPSGWAGAVVTVIAGNITGEVIRSIHGSSAIEQEAHIAIEGSPHHREDGGHPGRSSRAVRPRPGRPPPSRRAGHRAGITPSLPGSQNAGAAEIEPRNHWFGAPTRL
jgi:hypothetical protein